MKELTKAEEQIMNYVWKLEHAFLKDIVEQYPNPKPAYTTISTVVRVLVRKKFLGFNTYGKINEYYPLISKESYFKKHISAVIGNFFNGSKSKFASFFADTSDLSLNELEEIQELIHQKINTLKEKNDED